MAVHAATRLRFRALIGLAVLAGAFGLASSAWACSPTPGITLKTSSGQPGSRVLVSGTYFAGPVSGQPNPITIHWGTISGPVLDTVAGPSFNVYVEVPADAAPGPYLIGAAQHDPSGDIWRSQAFTVRRTSTTATTMPASGPVPPGADPAPEAQVEPAPAASQPQSPTSATLAAGATQVATPIAQSAERRTPAASPTSSSAAAPQPVALAAGRTAVLGGPQATVQPTGQPTVRPAVADGPATASAAAPTPASAAQSLALPRDVWAIDTAQRGIDAERRLTSPAAAGTAGVVFLAIGVSLLLAGFLVVTVARRRGAVRGLRPPTP